MITEITDLSWKPVSQHPRLLTFVGVLLPLTTPLRPSYTCHSKFQSQSVTVNGIRNHPIPLHYLYLSLSSMSYLNEKQLVLVSLSLCLH